MSTQISNNENTSTSKHEENGWKIVLQTQTLLIELNLSLNPSSGKIDAEEIFHVKVWKN